MSIFENIPELSQDAIDFFDKLPVPEQNKLIDEYNKFNPEIYQYSNLTERSLNYINQASNYYSEGTPSSVSTFINQDFANKQNLDFIDPSCFKNKKSELDSKLDTFSQNQLITAPFNLNAPNSNDFDGTELDNLLNYPNLDKFNRIVAPLSLTGKSKSGKEIHHMVSLIIEPATKKAMLIDQVGNPADGPYTEYKAKIRELLDKHGISGTNLIEPKASIMSNRNDCAIFAAYINQIAAKAKDLDDISQKVTDFSSKTDDEKNNTIDNFNRTSKDVVSHSLVELYKNNPLFKKYLEIKNIDFNNISDIKQQLQIIDQFTGTSQVTVNDLENLNTNNTDPTWKDEVRKAVATANKAVSADFTEYQDQDHPDLLMFKDSDDNKLAYASTSNVYVEGEQKAFDTLVESAKNLHKNSIVFGKFEQHPEYRAKLYLACLKKDMPMKNEPSLEELKQYPEYKQIIHEKARKGRAEIRNALQDKDCADLMKQYLSAKEKAEGTEADSQENKDLTKIHADLLKDKNYQKILAYTAIATEDYRINRRVHNEQEADKNIQSILNENIKPDNTNAENKRRRITQQILIDATKNKSHN